MKKYINTFVVIAVGFMFFSRVGFSAPVDELSAKEAAQTWIRSGYSMQKLSGKTVIDAERIEIGAENAHVVRISGGGIVLLSADDRIDPVIAFLPSSSDLTSDAGSPLHALLARDLAARMAAVTNTPVSRLATASASPSLTTAQSRWAKLLGKSAGLRLSAASSRSSSVSDVRVAPLIKSRWSQTQNSMYSNYGEPCFNYYTPGNSPCGCVATAMAQLMRYHCYPELVTPVSRVCRYGGTESSYAMKGGTYDYDDMPLVPEAYSGVSWYAGGATADQREAIGKLTYDCGVAMQMAWASGSSSSGGAAAHGPLKSIFGYANAHTTIYRTGLATAAYRERIIHTNLDAGYPVMLAVSGAGGHEILADGYGYSDDITYTHLNMGWASEDDVWYALPDMPTKNYNFSVVDGIIYNVFPDESGEIVSGRVVDGSGNPIDGARVDIKILGASVVLKTMSSSEAGIFGFIVPAEQSYVVTATFGNGSASTSVATGASADSRVTLKVGAYSYYTSDLTTEAACGNVSCGDLVLSSVDSVEAPVISPNGGLFYPTATVSMSCATVGATIRYTLDGSDPTETSPAYSAPFTLEDDTVVKARAFKGGMNPSIVVPATFTYDVAQGGAKGDYYSNPIRISSASGSYVIDDNSAYTLEDGEAKHTLVGSSYYSQYRSCWFAWTAPGSGTMTFTAKLDYMGVVSLPVIIAVYSDSATVPTDIASRLAMNYVTSYNCTANVELEVTQGTTYRIVVAAFNENDCALTLSWSGDLTVTKDETGGTEVPVPYAWLAAHYPAAHASTYETLANSTGANGLTVWQSYLAGLDPTDANSKLFVSIRMDGTTPVVEWNVTNATASSLGYSYKVLGNRSPGGNGWTDKTDSTHRFFKVVLEK